MRVLFFNLIILIGLGLVHSQQDLEFCGTFAEDPAKLSLPKTDPKAKFRLTLEQNEMGYTQEIEEYYDGEEEVAVSRTVSGSTTILTYSYYKTNELLVISGNTCQSKKLNESYGQTPFFLTVGQDGKEHPISSLAALFNLPIKFTYTGPSNVRGISVVEWQACSYDDKLKSTSRITVSFSHPFNWVPMSAMIGVNNYSVPVQVLIETKDRLANVKSSYYTITRYHPNLSTRADYYTPRSDLFCEGRENSKEIPTIPKSFSMLNQYIEPLQDSQFGLIVHIYEVYDFDNKLFRYDYIANNTPVTEVHDFNTGVSYVMRNYEGTCTFTEIVQGIDTGAAGGQGDLIKFKLRDPQAFFGFDNAKPQYVGGKHVDGIFADVWVGQKPAPTGELLTYEWHFMRREWSRPDVNTLQTQFPVLTIISGAIKGPNGQVINVRNQNHFMDFRERINDMSSFDVNTCHQRLPSKTFIFTVPIANGMQIGRYMEEFKSGTILALKTAAQVSTPLRISDIHLALERRENNLVVAVGFTIYEAAILNRTVANDISLEEAVTNLKEYFEDTQLDIKIPTESGSTTFYANKKSLKEFDLKGDYRFLFDVEEIEEGYSSGSVALFTIVITLVGFILAIGLVVLHKAQKVNVPFLNRF